LSGAKPLYRSLGRLRGTDCATRPKENARNRDSWGAAADRRCPKMMSNSPKCSNELRQPLGKLPALKARNLPRPRVLRSDSSRILLAELPVHKKRTLYTRSVVILRSKLLQDQPSVPTRSIGSRNSRPARSTHHERRPPCLLPRRRAARLHCRVSFSTSATMAAPRSFDAPVSPAHPCTFESASGI
jgi:hypothetical protein